MNNRFFEQNRSRGYFRRLTFGAGFSAIEALAANAIGSGIFNAAGKSGHNILDSLKMGTTGNAIVGAISMLILGMRNDYGRFSERNESNVVIGAIEDVAFTILAQMLGYGIFQDSTDMSLSAAVEDTSVGMAILFIPLILIYMYYGNDILDYLEAPFRENAEQPAAAVEMPANITIVMRR
jgi:hypothetical protein